MTEAIADVIENKYGDSDKKRKAETESVKANKEQRADIAVSNSQASNALLVAGDAAMESATQGQKRDVASRGDNVEIAGGDNRLPRNELPTVSIAGASSSGG